jgi:hypothetical protein
MSIRDAARIAALEARVSELVARVERLESVRASATENKVQRPEGAVPLRKGRR